MANFNLKAIISVVDRASGPMKGINRAIGGMAKRFGDIGTAGGSLASAFGVQQIAQSAIDFESTMADVKKVVDFDTPEGFAQMKDDILAMSKTLPMTANGIGQIVAAAGQSGIAREELATFAEDAAKMGIAFDLSADEAGDMMAKWRVAFGMTQDQVRTLADQVNYLGNTGPAKAAQISDVIRRVGALGDIGGVQAKYVAALGASIAGVGVESEVAATATKNFILSMVAGEAATKGQKKAFAALGIDTVKLSKAMQKDATGAFTKVLAAIEKLPKDRQATIMQEIFGKESLGAIAPLLKNLPNLRENIAKVSDATRYGGSMNKEYEARAATTANALILLDNQWHALKITLGDALLPTLNALMGPLGGIVDQIAAVAKANPEMTKFAMIGLAVASAVGVAGAAIVLLGGAVMSTLGSVLRLVWGLGVLAVRIAIAPAVLALRGALLAARGAMMLFNVAMAANPIGAVVAAVAALAGAVYLLYDNWGPVSDWFTGQWKAIKLVFSGFLAFLAGVFTGDFAAAMDGLKTIGQGLLDWFRGWGDAIGAVFGKVADWIKSLFDIDIAGALQGKLAALTGSLPAWVTDTLGLSVAAAPAGAAPSVAGAGASPVLAAGAQAQQLRGAVDININGAPPGTRVETRSDTKGVALNPDVGYRSLALGF
ncbi:phage tail tape measure protein [Azospirillum argentinense]|uniref:Phage tail tape measure protein n=1 Tax=Azospirillum brasilense TaxID=192 RepID=A0A4D8QB45_AZOBR|nr:phage tail tape measure protein [Azospirillum argentinense]QCO07538.1 phage tail tape measure protein [Azospirillum argentinense]